MSEMGDDDLLNDEEFDYEDYDITNEKEDALLQDEESNHLPEHEDHEDHLDKKESEDDNEEDVLELDYEAEEDLEDVEDKPAVTQSSEQRQYRKFVSENEKSSPSSDNSNNTTQKVISPQIVKKNFPSSNNKQVPPTSKKPNTQNSIKKAPPKFERRRGSGGGRGNFQNRSNFTRTNNIQKGRQERRNGKVYINPKYEGIVPVNESNGRLAWDNSNFAPTSNPQNIQPWVANATLQFDFQDPTTTLITNLVSNLANHSAIQIPQPQIQNTFEPPQQVPQVFQHNNLAFQPPANTAPMQTYSSQNQVSGRQPFPSQMPPLLPTPQRYSNQPVNRMQEGPKPFNSYSDTNNYYDRPNNQHTYPQDFKKDYPPTNFESRNTNNTTSYNKTLINNKSDWYDYGNNRTDTFKSDSYSGYSEPNDFSMKTPSYGSYYQKKNQASNFPPKTTFSSTYTNDYSTKTSLYGNDTYQSRYPLPPSGLFAKSYTAGKVEDRNKNLNPTLKTGDSNRGPMTYAPLKLGDNRSNQSLYAPRRQDLSNDYSKRMNYSNLDHNNSTKLENYQSLSYDNKPEEQKPVYSNYNAARPDQEQRYYNRKEDNKLSYDNRSNFYGNRNYTKQADDYMKESSNSVNFKNNWSQNKNYNRNVQNSSLPNNRRAITNEISDIKVELPIKRMKSSEEETAKKTGIKAEAPPADNKIAMEEEEDEETRLYRLKIEDQKKQRERIWKLKEERRKQALQEAKKEEMAAQKLENKPQDLLKTAPIAPIPNYQKKQQIYNIPVLSAQLAAKSSSDKLSLTFNIQNDLQTTNAGASQKSESSGFMSNRVVLVKNSQKGVSSTNSSSNVVKTVPVIESGNETNDVGQNISSFFNNRKVLKKDSNLINTRLVVVNNLSASTSENKLVSMTKGIGEIQKLRMDRQERQATILFKTVASAHAFFKKYQRHMLDLSMIEVRLENML